MNAEVPYDINTTRYGIAWTLAGTLPQIAVGPWLLMTLPQGVRDGLVDGGSLSSLVFFLSLTFALLALVLLNAALMVPHVRGLVWSGIGSLILTVVLMLVVRGEVRKAWISSHLESKTVGRAFGLGGPQRHHDHFRRVGYSWPIYDFCELVRIGRINLGRFSPMKDYRQISWKMNKVQACTFLKC